MWGGCGTSEQLATGDEGGKGTGCARLLEFLSREWQKESGYEEENSNFFRAFFVFIMFVTIIYCVLVRLRFGGF